MITYVQRKHSTLMYKFFSSIIAFTFAVSVIMPPMPVAAQTMPVNVLNLPLPGTMVNLTNTFIPTIVRGLTIHPDDPLLFGFLIDKGAVKFSDSELKVESDKLIKYFLASLTIPEEEIWVNLSPYETDRVISKKFGDTLMGRDLLAQDYLLKQLSASLMYPEEELGKKFWDRVYKKAYEKFGTTDIPMNTFNKIWVVPDRAEVYEKDTSVYVIDSHLKVMLEEDYLALEKNMNNTSDGLIKRDAQVISGVSSEIIREVLIPEIEREVNQGKTFANLRQIYHSMILAAWYKESLKNSLLGQVYANQGKTKGVDTQDKTINQKIYDQYTEAFRTGVYNYIREDYDPTTQEIVPRKYFSGGMALQFGNSIGRALRITRAGAGGLAHRIHLRYETAMRRIEDGLSVQWAALEFGSGVSEGALAAVEAAALSTDTSSGQVAMAQAASPVVLGQSFQEGVLSVAEDGVAAFDVKADRSAGSSPVEFNMHRRSFLRLGLAGLGLGLGFPGASLAAEPEDPVLAWLKGNVFEDGMPRLHELPTDRAFWQSVQGDTEIDGIIERTIIRYGLSIYDGGVWQAAMAASGDADNIAAADVFTKTLLSGRWGRLRDIRAYRHPFTYQGQRLGRNEALFFRLLAPVWEQRDPLTGKTHIPGFPAAPDYDRSLIVHADWKPIMGDNIWGAIIGPLQVAFAKWGVRVPLTSDELTLAKSIIPALKALTVETGAILHAPAGTDGKRPDDVSYENQESAYAGLRMLHQITGDSVYLDMMRGIENHMKRFGYDKRVGIFHRGNDPRGNGVIYQGGFSDGSNFTPNVDDFAVDSNTWALAVFGPDKINEWYEDIRAAYQIWTATKFRAGYYVDGVLRGVGYTDGHDIFSPEWTLGAVVAALELALY